MSDPSRRTPTTRNPMDWHVQSVYKDPEFQEDVLQNYRIEENLDADRVLAQKYYIKPYDVHYYRMSQIIALPASTRRKFAILPDSSTRQIIIKMDPTITKAEYLEAWTIVKGLQQSLYKLPGTKRKPPENTDLLYAVFKARKSHTFREIFEMYSTGTLKNYSGSTGQFKSEEALQRYYDRYKPTKPGI